MGSFTDYQVLKAPHPKPLLEQLVNFGNQGWKLEFILPHENCYVYYFSKDIKAASYEYKLISVSTPLLSIDQLIEFAKDGWRFMFIVPFEKEFVFYFNRNNSVN